MKPGKRPLVPLVAGVIGDPIQHSLSPEIFQFISKRVGYPVRYERFHVKSQDFKHFLNHLRQYPLLHGVNVTLPYKEKIISQLQEVTFEAKSVGAVNVVKVEAGKLLGYNTDLYGIQKTLFEQGVKPKKITAVIFGAGGAALSVGYVLGHGKAKQVTIFNRNERRAKRMAVKLAKLFPATTFVGAPLEGAAKFNEPADLYVQSTPLGMKGFPSVSLLPKKLSTHALAFDLVYRPEETPFLKDAKKRGLRTVGGLDMLVWQALAAWEIWVGPLTNSERLKSHLMLYLRRKIKKV